jgi:hypothetical protein
VITNDALEDTVNAVSAVIDAECLARPRVRGLEPQITHLLGRIEEEITAHAG